MFQRYTEPARRAIFIARYEAGQAGSSFIETHHILLGLLTVNPDAARTVSISSDAILAVRDRLNAEYPPSPAIATTVDLPLSHEAKRVLAYAAEESERLRHRFIGPEHLFLGLLREDASTAARILREHGMELAAFRTQLAELRSPFRVTGTAPQTPASFSLEDMHRMLEELPEDRRNAAGSVLYDLGRDFVSVTVSTQSGAYTATFGQPVGLPEFDFPYSERARRALEIARSEATRFAAQEVETEHVLLAIFQEDRALAVRLLGSPLQVEAIRRDVQARTPEVRAPESAPEFPFSRKCRRALAFAAAEAQAMGQTQIETAHLVFGLLRVDDSFAAGLLAKRNVNLPVAQQRLAPSA